MSVEWADVAEAFEPDGALRDIYVLGTTRREWRLLLDALVGGPWPAELLVQGAPPKDAIEALRALDDPDTSSSLRLDVGGALINCHFFHDDDIEFDLSPAEFGEANFEELCRFLAFLGSVTGLDARVTEENHPQDVILEYTATTRSFKAHSW